MEDPSKGGYAILISSNKVFNDAHINNYILSMNEKVNQINKNFEIRKCDLTKKCIKHNKFRNDKKLIETNNSSLLDIVKNKFHIINAIFDDKVPLLLDGDLNY